jgi:ATP-dependent helicase/nuclease subunit B
MTARVYTIPPFEAFLDRLAEGLWTQAACDPLRLAEMRVLLPTRRATLHLRTAFLRVTGGAATLLPRVQQLGDLEEGEFYFAGADREIDLSLPPAIAPLRRQLLLARMIRARDRDMPLDQAAQLATALGDLLDQVQTERRDFKNLEKLVPADYARHWQETVAFLKILTDNWPQMLVEEGCLDPAERRNRLLAAQAELWRAHPPDYPVIAAGSTGSIPATADLLNVIAGLQQGAVVLPGLDCELAEDAWQAIGESHPQFGMKQLIEKFGVERKDVRGWRAGSELACSSPLAGEVRRGVQHKGDPSPANRVRLLQESMRPAEVSDGWRELDGKQIPRDALKDISRLTLDNAQEEAQTVALLLRGALEVPGKTAMLVTTDRDLAARVAAQLARWKILANDSAGLSLAVQPIGGFLEFVLDAAQPGASNIDRLALLKHPFAACGLDPAQCRAHAREAEMKIWRARETAKDAEEISGWLAMLEEWFQPLRQDWRRQRTLGEWLDLHLALALRLAASDTEEGSARLWRGEDGEAAAQWCDQLREAAHDFPPLTGREYADLFKALLRDVTVRLNRGQHPRLAILGPLEARLIHADLVILGSLNEGTWPPETSIDPWMSRPMKRDFGLPLPERRIGLSAHDFLQLASAPEVVLTRARRAGHAPTVPSRFLLQLETVLQALGYHDDKNDALKPAAPWGEWAAALDEPANIAACARPEPRPPLTSRPQSLHVTEIGRWRRNPYAIYARHILKLEKLEPLEEDATAAERGIVIHRALEQFLRKYPGPLPDNALGELLSLGRNLFAAYPDPQVAAFWWPRFERSAIWFVDYERSRRAQGIAVAGIEARGEMLFGQNNFMLKGRADRIDRLPDGSLAIIDYKTGGVPKQWEVAEGYEPQLPLLALMAAQGGFADIEPAPVSVLSYWQLGGSLDAGGEKPVKGAADDLAAAARQGLEDLIAGFADPRTPYLAVPKPGLAPRYDDYAHLARLAEWGRSGEET